MPSGDMNESITPFIMCGGSGSRLWPVSRLSMPKQFQSLVGALTLVQDTTLRVTGPAFAPAVFVTGEDHRFVLADQLDALGLPRGPIVLEPMGRNTAAIALVASLLASRDGDALVLLLPSDHLMGDTAAFAQMVSAAVPAARAGHICLFGVQPLRPETGYGYIEVGSEAIPDADSLTRKVTRFVEKPDAERAADMVSAGNFVWNSGIFLFLASTMLREAEERRPALLSGVREALDKSTRDGDFLRLDPDAFERVESISLDYAILEGSARSAVLPAELDWSDLGAWDAVFAAHQPDADGNVVLGRALGVRTKDSFVRSTEQLVTTIGVSDLLIVATSDAVLVAGRAEAQAVKEAVSMMQAKGLEEAAQHADVHRPWGKYRSVLSGARFQVKLITVKPGGRLSLQFHHHRAEHWVVVKGTARIVCGDRSFILHENQSTYIPKGEMHRLENPGKIPLEMVEVQSGEYLGEDDIIRVEDEYGRN